MNKVGSMITGALVGAVVVGAVWTGVSLTGGGKVATVGNNTITQKDLNQELEQQAGPQGITQLIVNHLLDDAAKKYNVTATDADITAGLNDFKSQNQITSDSDLNTFLSQNHVTLAQIKDGIKYQVLMQKLGERNVKVSDSEIQQYYNQNKASEFTTQETVTASHILVATQAQAEDIEKQLKNGADFATLAKKYSTDTGSKDQGGSLGTFPKGTMVPEFEKVAFAQKVGTISDPVKTQYGWHIIKVTAHTPAKTETLAEAKSKIIDDIKKQKAEAEPQLIADLLKEDPLTIQNPTYSWIKDQLENPAPAQDPTGGAGGAAPTDGTGSAAPSGDTSQPNVPAPSSSTTP